MNRAFDDEAGDVPPIGGFHDDERRGQHRREEDKLLHDSETWTARLMVGRFKPLAFAITLTGVLTWFVTSLGYRYVGPREDIRALDAKFTQKDSLMNIRVTGLEDGQGRIRIQLATIEENGRFMTFLLCTSLRTSNPTLALDGCPTRRP